MRCSDNNSSEYETVCRQFLSSAAISEQPSSAMRHNIKAKVQPVVHRQQVMDNRQCTLYGHTRIRSITICGGTLMMNSPG
jgi:hypothetical protein